MDKKSLQAPVERKWFEVNPQTIDRKLFQKKREDEEQEKTRLLILDAFTEMRNNPQKYGRTFETLIPERLWSKSKNIYDLRNLANIIGDHNANWVEQALEWAQRISNGETWEVLCNEPDTANWFRVVEWKNGHARFVGGSRADKNPASSISHYDIIFASMAVNAVPLIVRYK